MGAIVMSLVALAYARTLPYGEGAIIEPTGSTCRVSSVIYLVQGEDRLVAMREEPYDSEALLQRLLESYPDLLTGDQVDTDHPRQWLLVSSEMGLASDDSSADRWAVDHLFLDQEGIPTIVEVKRSTDSRIRREVVGQMFDYAANAIIYWPVERLRASFEERHEAQGEDPEQALLAAFGPELDLDHFWRSVETNLQAGRVRLVFVADVIPVELRRIIEYLNHQMQPTEVLGVEVKQYVGEGVQSLVPRTIGNTSTGRSEITPAERWTAETFDRTLVSAYGEAAVCTARRFREWAESRSLWFWWGRGRQSGSCYLMDSYNGERHWIVSLWTDGKVVVEFAMMATRRPFADEALRMELRERLNEVPGVTIEPDRIAKYPSIPITTLTDPDTLDQFLAVLDWVVDQIRGYTPGARGELGTEQ